MRAKEERQAGRPTPRYTDRQTQRQTGRHMPAEEDIITPFIICNTHGGIDFLSINRISEIVNYVSCL